MVILLNNLFMQPMQYAPLQDVRVNIRLQLSSIPMGVCSGDSDVRKSTRRRALPRAHGIEARSMLAQQFYVILRKVAGLGDALRALFRGATNLL